MMIQLNEKCYNHLFVRRKKEAEYELVFKARETLPEEIEQLLQRDESIIDHYLIDDSLTQRELAFMISWLANGRDSFDLGDRLHYGSLQNEYDAWNRARIEHQKQEEQERIRAQRVEAQQR